MAVSCADFEFVRGFVRARSAIALEAGKEYLVEARLAPLARREGFPSVAALISSLRHEPAPLADDVVSAMATHETLFFRDVHPFDALRETVIPEVLARRKGQVAMWSAGASTGQEPYSLAMLLQDHFPNADASILATDIASDVIEHARLGRFTQLEVNRGLPAALLVRHFERDGRSWTVKPAVRRAISFRALNLVGRLDAVPPMDIVLLRNVLIYFDLATKASVLAAVRRVLRPGGYLFLGASETTYGIDDSYTLLRVGRTVCYRRPDGIEPER